MNLNWPLATDSFSFKDRLKVALFVLNKKNQLTMGPKVAEFEKIMSEYGGAKALATSSGSTANSLIFECWKQNHPEKFKNCIVVCPAVTWISSVSPLIMAGYTPVFCDVNLNDFCFDYNKLEKILEKNKDKNIIIWPTALIGFCPDFGRLKSLARRYGAWLFGDFCENQFSTYSEQSILSQVEMSSLSCYFSHQTTSVEMGFVFFKNNKDYEYCKMLRNHGMTRSLNEDSFIRKDIEKRYPNIDKQFLFGVLGTNWRTSDMHAIWGLQDIKRAKAYKKFRKDIYNQFSEELDRSKYYLPSPESSLPEHVAFCLPIFKRDIRQKTISDLKTHLNSIGVATRPIIGGCITLQPPLQKYHSNDFTNALWVHERGAYVGLNYDLTKKKITKLVNVLNKF
jgi:CDP-6-deoxy-D-xylo-4-hexulose-3-dehydrase